MVRADVIAMATPVYFYTMAAQMKTLIDRCCARYTEISGKEFYLLLTAAEEEREKMLRTADTFQGFFDCLEEPHLRATVFGTGVWHDIPPCAKPTKRGKASDRTPPFRRPHGGLRKGIPAAPGRKDCERDG